MSDINALGASNYYSGIQNASSEVIRNNQKEKISKEKKVSFKDIFKTKEENNVEPSTINLPSEIRNMSVEEAAIFLKDAVDIAGDALSNSPTGENIKEFKSKVQQFIHFVIQQNFVITAKQRNRMVTSTGLFSNYQLPPHKKDPRVQIELINTKLDEMTRATLSNQINNLKLLEQVNEIKGLIIDLMQS